MSAANDNFLWELNDKDIAIDLDTKLSAATRPALVDLRLYPLETRAGHVTALDVIGFDVFLGRLPRFPYGGILVPGQTRHAWYCGRAVVSSFPSDTLRRARDRHRRRVTTDAEWQLCKEGRIEVLVFGYITSFHYLDEFCPNGLVIETEERQLFEIRLAHEGRPGLVPATQDGSQAALGAMCFLRFMWEARKARPQKAPTEVQYMIDAFGRANRLGVPFPRPFFTEQITKDADAWHGFVDAAVGNTYHYLLRLDREESRKLFIVSVVAMGVYEEEFHAGDDSSDGSWYASDDSDGEGVPVWSATVAGTNWVDLRPRVQGAEREARIRARNA